MLNKIVGFTFIFAFGFILYYCASSNRASYYYVGKQLEHEDLNFHKTIRVNEYINAFDQSEIKVPDSQMITLKVDPFYTQQSLYNSDILIQVAIKTGMDSIKDKSTINSLCFVLDISGSMGFDNKIVDAKQALQSAVSLLKDGDEFALVTFNNNATTLIEPQSLNQNNRRQIRQIIQSLSENGGTNIQDGLIQGYFEMTKFKNAEHPRLLLLTDGNSNITTITPKQMAKKLKIEYVEGLRISTIGLGYDVNQDLLRNIAEEGGGHYYFVDKSETLTSIIKNDLASLILPAAKNILLSIKANPDFSIRHVYGIEEKETISSKSVLVEYQELNMDDWRIIILEIERNNTIAGTFSPITAKLECDIVDRTQKINLEKTTNISWIKPDDFQPVGPNRVVVKNSLIYGNAVSLIQVGKLSEQNNIKEALNILNLQINNNIVFYEINSSPEIKSEIERLIKVRKILLNRVKDESPEIDNHIIFVQEEMFNKTNVNNDNTKKDDFNKLIGFGLDIAEIVTPGLWTSLARLISDAIF